MIIEPIKEGRWIANFGKRKPYYRDIKKRHKNSFNDLVIFVTCKGR
jgi:hypothetical protein